MNVTSKIYMLIQKQFLKRLFLYILGLFILALGVDFAVNSQLGISPVNFVPYVVSEIIGVDQGICVTALLLIFMLGQIILLRKEYKLIDLTQIIFAVIFGYFISLTRFVIGDFQIPTYAGQFLKMAIGIALISAGLTLYMEAQIVNLPAEGFLKALTYKIKNSKIHRVKIAMDSTLVIIGIILSLVFLGRFYGIREGTVISAVFIGKLMPFCKKLAEALLLKAGLAQENTEN